MARTILWKVTVALNVLLSLSIISAFAQSPTLNNVKINYTCRSERLESVIENLSKTSGYDFIYSRNIVDISKTVSLNVKNKTINEVLALIEQQVDVSFKLKDHHIIVKSVPKPAAPTKLVAPATIFAPEAPLITSISKEFPSLSSTESHTAILQKSLDRRINEVQKMLGSGTPRNMPPSYLSQINFNNRHRSWFAAVGTFVSDEGSGLELQAGLPMVYAVFHPHVSLSDGFYGSYGVGNSLNLVGNFSFNAIYLYSTRTTSEMTTLPGPFNMDGPTITRTQSIRQHQIKMTIQYSFSKNLAVRMGPVLNYRSTLKEISITPATVSETISTTGGYGNGGGYIIHNRRFESSTRLLESWVGWDASIQYRINFFERK